MRRNIVVAFCISYGVYRQGHKMGMHGMVGFYCGRNLIMEDPKSVESGLLCTRVLECFRPIEHELHSSR
jgi:hypothetical protein